jgi:hypothetical protein
MATFANGALLSAVRALLNATGLYKNVVAQSSIPGPSNDNTQGYEIGSRWKMTNGDVYECRSASTGAAVWDLYLMSNGDGAPALKSSPISADTVLGTDSAASNAIVEFPMTAFRRDYFVIDLSDQSTDLAVATGVYSFVMPESFTLNDPLTSRPVEITVGTAPTGAAIIVDMNENGVSVFGTRPQIDATETSSATGVAGTITDTVLAKGSVISFDIDQVGSGTKGKKLQAIIRGYWN